MVHLHRSEADVQITAGTRGHGPEIEMDIARDQVDFSQKGSIHAKNGRRIWLKTTLLP
jgi:hypothetical protein